MKKNERSLVSRDGSAYFPRILLHDLGDKVVDRFIVVRIDDEASFLKGGGYKTSQWAFAKPELMSCGVTVELGAERTVVINYRGVYNSSIASIPIAEANELIEKLLPFVPEKEKAMGSEGIPTTAIDFEGHPMEVALVFHAAGLVKSASEGRRLIQQGGAYVSNKRVENFDLIWPRDDEVVEIRMGKKKYHHIISEEK